MSTLTLLWLASLGIVAAALLIMVGLLVARVIIGRLRRARQEQRQLLVSLLLGEQAEEEEIERVHAQRGREKTLLTELAVELIQLVRGSDHERFIERATRMGVPERLRHRMDSGSARVRLAAAEALSQFHDQKSLERLCAALEDRNPDVRLSVALALASLGRAPSARELVEKLGIGTREDSLLTVSLFREIARQRPEEIRALILDESVPARAKAAAIESLSASGDYSLVPLITSLALATDLDAPVLGRYLKALGDFAHPAGAPALKRAFRSPSWEVRAAAAEAAGRMALDSLGPHIKQLLADESWWVRFRAGEALAKLGERGSQLLREAARSQSELARTAAALTLAERGLE